MKNPLVVLAVALCVIATLDAITTRLWRTPKFATTSVSQAAATAPVRAEQKTYRVTFRVAPEVQSRSREENQ